jgi:hypothetical protein
MYGAIEYLRDPTHVMSVLGPRTQFQVARNNSGILGADMPYLPLLQAAAVGYALIYGYALVQASYEAGGLEVPMPSKEGAIAALPAVGLYVIGAYLGNRACGCE